MEVITTSVTNLDIHDIARCAITYNLERYYIIHPLPNHHQLIQDIINYWQVGFGAIYNPDRKMALDLVELKESIDEVKKDISNRFKAPLYTITTDARTYPNTISYKELHSLLEDDAAAEANYLLLFGTGWGMTKETMLQADYVLEPIYGRGPYNHLSVRSAVSIILDRILGEKWWE
jgi:hypothetical protein